MEQTEHTAQTVQSDGGAADLLPIEHELEGEAALGLALIAEVLPTRGVAALAPAAYAAPNASFAPPTRLSWAREPAFWVALALAAVLRLWRLEASPLAIGVALASVLGVGICYVWARRAFGWEVALSSALLFACWGPAVASGRSASSLGLVPPLLALWALALFTGSAAGRATWLLAAALVLAVASLLLPVAGLLALVLLFADLLLPTPETPPPGRELRTVLLVGLPLVAAAWGTALRMPANAALDGWRPLDGRPLPAPLPLAVVSVCAVGWLALTWLLLAPVGDLRRWYALASDPQQRRAAIWAGLRADPRWRARALLWLGIVGLALALPAFPSQAAGLALMPLLLALPGMVATWLRARSAPRWVPALWLGVVGLLAVALALSAFGGVA